MAKAPGQKPPGPGRPGRLKNAGPRGPGRLNEREIARTLRAVKRAGGGCVEVMPDRIRITIGEPAPVPTPVDAFAEWKAKQNADAT
jgi:hypothetical protein